MRKQVRDGVRNLRVRVVKRARRSGQRRAHDAEDGAGGFHLCGVVGSLKEGEEVVQVCEGTGGVRDSKVGGGFFVGGGQGAAEELDVFGGVDEEHAGEGGGGEVELGEGV